MRSIRDAARLAAAAVLAAVSLLASAQRHDFGEVGQGDVIEHEFAIGNDSQATMRIAGVQLTPPLALARMPAVIPPGGRVLLEARLDTRRVEGPYEGQIVVTLAGGEQRIFTMAGRVVPPIEVRPLPAFFISTPRGVAKTASVEIVNRETAPLTLAVPASVGRFETRLETIEPGRRFRLSLTVPADLPAGRHADRLEIRTSSVKKPVLFVGVNARVRERVYTFPDGVDLGETRPGASRPQTLMVYQTGGSDFTVTARSDVPGLRIEVEPGPERDRAQVTVSIDPSRAPAGPIRGTILLRTNDPDFAEIRVPVVGTIAPR